MHQSAKKPLISVIIPVKNGEATICQCLDGIFAQKFHGNVEIVIIDSGSTDRTSEFLASYPVSVERIDPRDFNHGDTRNLGVRMARGEFVVMTVQDARPANDQWLERMLQHFDDPNVAGVCGQQAVAHEAQNNPLQWFRPCSEPTARKVWFADPVAFERLTPAEQVALCRWDDVTAMYRRSTLLELPFQRVSFAEDMIWAKGALLRGRALVYEYSARVYHYHSQSFRFRFRRVFTIKYHLHAYFSHVATPNWLLPKLARCVYWSAQPKYCPERRVNWCAHNVSLLLADWLAGWCFWFAWKGGGQKFVNRAHARLCAQPPQPVKAA